MKIKVFADFREICGGKVVHLPLDGSQPIIAILESLIQQFPKMNEEIFTENKALKPLVSVFINGQNIIHLDGLESIVSENDQVALFPPVAGG